MVAGRMGGQGAGHTHCMPVACLPLTPCSPRLYSHPQADLIGKGRESKRDRKMRLQAHRQWEEAQDDKELQQASLGHSSAPRQLPVCIADHLQHASRC